MREPATPGIPAAGRARESGVVIASAALSLALHGSVLAAAMTWIDARPGATEWPTEAISLDLLPSAVVEVAAEAPSPEAAASPASVASVPGSDEADAVPAVQADTLAALEAVRPAEIEESAPQGLDVIEGTEVQDAPAGREAERPRKQKKDAAREESRPAREKPADARRKGGVAARASAASAAASGRVSASTGSVLDYAARVRARVVGHKPVGAGRRGTVVVAFGVSRSGGLSYAGVARSSGDAGLDRSVLAAVRRAAPFPAPPPGASPAQLRFTMPFNFR